MAGTMEGRPVLNRFARKPKVANARWLMGSLITFLATGEDTGGRLCLFEAIVRGGGSVPPHTHSREDETVYVIEGELLYTVGDESYRVAAGDAVFLPRHVQHAWKALTETARMLTWIQPAGLEEAFIRLSEPAPAFELPPAADAPPDEAFIRRAVAVHEEYGVVHPPPPDAPE